MFLLLHSVSTISLISFWFRNLWVNAGLAYTGLMFSTGTSDWIVKVEDSRFADVLVISFSWMLKILNSACKWRIHVHVQWRLQEACLHGKKMQNRCESHAKGTKVHPDVFFMQPILEADFDCPERCDTDSHKRKCMKTLFKNAWKRRQWPSVQKLVDEIENDESSLWTKTDTKNVNSSTWCNFGCCSCTS